VVGGLEVPGGGPGGDAPAAAFRVILLPEAAAAPPAPKPAARGTASPLQRYYRRSELDAVPSIMTRVNPEYPHLVHVSGKVKIRLFIDERGIVERVAVLHAEPPGYFEASAQRAFLGARFTPGMRKGAAVKSQLTLQVDYTSRP
jgi:protein TonB